MYTNAIVLKSEVVYKNKLGQSIKVIKENGLTIFRSIDGEIIRDLRKPIGEYNYQTLEEISNDNKLMSIARKCYSNENIRKAVKVLGCFIIAYVIAKVQVVSTVAFAYEDLAVFEEFTTVNRFIDMVISVIRTLSVGICALITANAGLSLLTDETTDGKSHVKKVVNKILWALFLIFAGTALASFFAKKLMGI